MEIDYGYCDFQVITDDFMLASAQQGRLLVDQCKKAKEKLQSLQDFCS